MCDAIMIGGGSAGLTAGLCLCKGKYRTLFKNNEFGGPMMNYDNGRYVICALFNGGQSYEITG